LLVCWVCKLVIEDGPEELDEHMTRDHEFDDAQNRYILSACVLLFDLIGANDINDNVLN